MAILGFEDLTNHGNFNHRSSNRTEQEVELMKVFVAEVEVNTVKLSQPKDIGMCHLLKESRPTR